ncbi:MAG: rRNA processing protein RimM [Gammaproteobacteria bacterium]|nr:rRNA processing protein RimM [Gammaproteobacteria bacterium]
MTQDFCNTPEDSSAKSIDKVIVARVGAVYGVKGWLKIHSFTQPRENIFNYAPWFIKKQGIWQPIEVAEFAEHTTQMVILFADCNDRDAAQLYTGAEIAVERKQLPKLAKNEYYWSDLEGLTVINTEDIILGKVDYLFETGSNDVLVVKGDKQYLIPFLLDQFILNIDLPNKIIQVAWDVEF